MKKYIFIIIFLILIGTPFIAFAEVRLGLLPIKWKGSEISSQFKKEIEKNILENLEVPSQLVLIPLKEKERNSQIHYILNISIKSSENFSEITFDLKDNIFFNSIYSKKEKIENLQLPFKVKTFCEEIKNVIFSQDITNMAISLEKESFGNKINLINKINNLFLKIFSSKEEFEVKINIPPPPPPPGYSINPALKINPQSLKSVEPQSLSSKEALQEVYHWSPWQWF